MFFREAGEGSSVDKEHHEGACSFAIMQAHAQSQNLAQDLEGMMVKTRLWQDDLSEPAQLEHLAAALESASRFPECHFLFATVSDLLKSKQILKKANSRTAITLCTAFLQQGIYIDDFFLYHNLEDSVENWDPQLVARFMSGISRVNMKVNSDVKRGISRMLANMEHKRSAGKCDGDGDRALCTILTSLSKFNLLDREFLTCVSRVIQETDEQLFTAPTISVILKGYANLAVRDFSLFRRLLRRATRLEVSSWTPMSLSGVLSSCNKLSIRFDDAFEYFSHGSLLGFSFFLSPHARRCLAAIPTIAPEDYNSQ
eukprot:762562-Hanusia_phi.AAC.2